MPTEEEAAVRTHPILRPPRARRLHYCTARAHMRRQHRCSTKLRHSRRGPRAQFLSPPNPPDTDRAAEDPAGQLGARARRRREGRDGAPAVGRLLPADRRRGAGARPGLAAGGRGGGRDDGGRAAGRAARGGGRGGGGDGGKEAAAAAAIQAAMRGKVVRAEFQDFKDETARQQWMAYYLELGEYDAAKEYGWEPPPGWTPPAAGEAPAAVIGGRGRAGGAAAQVWRGGGGAAGDLERGRRAGRERDPDLLGAVVWAGLRRVHAARRDRGGGGEEERGEGRNSGTGVRADAARAHRRQGRVAQVRARPARPALPHAAAPAPPPLATPLPDGPAACTPSLTALRHTPPPSGTVCSLCTRTSRRSTRRRSRRSSASPAASRTRRWPS